MIPFLVTLTIILIVGLYVYNKISKSEDKIENYISTDPESCKNTHSKFFEEKVCPICTVENDNLLKIEVGEIPFKAISNH
jgi:hypothetical protein